MKKAFTIKWQRKKNGKDVLIEKKKLVGLAPKDNFSSKLNVQK
jgi:hypothetical protein